MNDIDFDDDLDLDALLGEAAPPTMKTGQKPPTTKPNSSKRFTGPDPGADDDFDDDFFGVSGLSQQERVEDSSNLMKPWMRYHEFHLVSTIEGVKEVVDKALAHGRCALDLETEGFDNRIDYDASNMPSTRHQIVGYCISVKAVGYYIPVRHFFDPTFGDVNPNVDPKLVGAEIRRLCQAAQPVITTEGKAKDPFASSDIETPGKLVIYFWNAKFDHEFLLPVTGIDAWHPSSFEDGMLAAYAYYSDDKNKGLKGKAKQNLFVTDPEDVGSDGKPIVHPYEMIEFADLFRKGLKKAKRKFSELSPKDGNATVLYGCSDAICTELLCESRKVKWALTKEGLTTKYKDVISPIKKSNTKYLWSTYHRIEKQVTAATREMERPRTQIDLQATVELLEEAKKEFKVFEEKIVKLAASKGFPNFNPSSPQQLGDFLFGIKGLDISPKPEKTASGQFKTDGATLDALFEANPSIEVLEWIVKYRQIEKVVGTYLKGIAANTDENGCLRFNFKQTGAATGRFSAPKGEPSHGFSGIPIHGIPARDDPKKPKVAHSQRRLFIARPGYTFVKVDYAGQELRVVANISGEQVWIKEFLEGDGDLHTLTAQAFYPDLDRSNKADFKIKRTAGKIANFSLIYGGGVQAIMRATGCDKVEAARKLKAFHASVPAFAAWVTRQHKFVKTKKGVFTGFQRFIRIPDASVKVGDYIYGKEIVDDRDARRIRAACERKSTNYPIQGSGADILKISMIKLHKELMMRGWLKSYNGDDSVRMIMTVHDEICFEVKHERLMEAMPVIIDIMESPSRLIASWKVPLIVEPEFGLNWSAEFDWLKVMKGEKPVPDWLEGIVTPGNAPKVDLPRTFKESPSKSGNGPAPTALTNSTPTSNGVSAPVSSKPPSSGSNNSVVTFTIPKAYVTLQLVEIMMEVVAGSVRIPEPHKGTLLQVVNSVGETLIDSKLGIRIDPNKFGRKLRERNLGRGAFKRSEPSLVHLSNCLK